MGYGKKGKPIVIEQPSLTEVKSELAQKVSQGEVSVFDIDKNKGKFDQTYMSDEFLGQMAGNTPINSTPAPRSVTTDHMVDGAITGEKTEFINVDKSINLFNPETITVDHYVSKADGSLIANTSWDASDWMEVEPNTQYVSTDAKDAAFYDINKQFISGVVWSGSNLTTPENAYYVRMTVSTSGHESKAFAEGATLPNPFVPYYRNLSLNESVEVNSMPFSNVEGLLFPNRMEFVQQEESVNKVDEYISSETGYWSNGTIKSGYFHKTELIPIKPSTQYTCYKSIIQTFWNADKNYLSEINAKTFTTPVDAAYIGFNTWDDPDVYPERAMLAEGSSYPTEFISFHAYKLDENIKISQKIEHPNPLRGKILNALGDSLTEGVGTTKQYHQFIKEKGELSLVRNYGIGGSTISNLSTNNPMCIRYTDMDNDADIVVLLAGINDKNNSVPLGTISSTIDTEFYGACHKLFKGLRDKYPIPRTKIAIFTPIYDGGNFDTQKLYVNAIKEVAERYSIPCFDLFAHSEVYPPILHPDINGHQVMGEKMYNFIASLF